MIVRKRDSKHSCIRRAHRSNRRVDDVIAAATTTGTISASTQTRWSREVRFHSIILIVIEDKGGLERKLTTSVWDGEVECRAGCDSYCQNEELSFTDPFSVLNVWPELGGNFWRKWHHLCYVFIGCTPVTLVNAASLWGGFYFICWRSQYRFRNLFLTASSETENTVWSKWQSSFKEQSLQWKQPNDCLIFVVLNIY